MPIIVSKCQQSQYIYIHIYIYIYICALGSIMTNKASGGDGIPVELFQIIKDEAVIVLH